MSKIITSVSLIMHGHLLLKFEDGSSTVIIRGNHEALEFKAGDQYPPAVVELVAKQDFAIVEPVPAPVEPASAPVAPDANTFYFPGPPADEEGKRFGDDVNNDYVGEGEIGTLASVEVDSEVEVVSHAPAEESPALDPADQQPEKVAADESSPQPEPVPVEPQPESPEVQP